jgi:hypothetical protein
MQHYQKFCQILFFDKAEENATTTFLNLEGGGKVKLTPSNDCTKLITALN